MNIREIALNVVSEFKNSFLGSSTESFINQTLYVAINSDKDIRVSMSSDILDAATEAIIILIYSRFEIKNSYWWYCLRHIAANGEVSKSYSELDFKISPYSSNGFKNQYLGLSCGNYQIFSIQLDNNSWNDEFKKLWKIFLLVKECQTLDEMLWLTKKYELQKEIESLNSTVTKLKIREVFLQDQLDQYKNLLDRLNEQTK